MHHTPVCRCSLHSHPHCPSLHTPHGVICLLPCPLHTVLMSSNTGVWCCGNTASHSTAVQHCVAGLKCSTASQPVTHSQSFQHYTTNNQPASLISLSPTLPHSCHGHPESFLPCHIPLTFTLQSNAKGLFLFLSLSNAKELFLFLSLNNAKKLFLFLSLISLKN